MASESAIKDQFSTTEKSNNETDTASISKGALQVGFRAWAKKLSVETGGIERITDEERMSNTTHVWNACTFWFVFSAALLSLVIGN